MFEGVEGYKIVLSEIQIPPLYCMVNTTANLLVWQNKLPVIRPSTRLFTVALLSEQNKFFCFTKWAGFNPVKIYTIRQTFGVPSV